MNATSSRTHAPGSHEQPLSRRSGTRPLLVLVLLGSLFATGTVAGAAIKVAGLKLVPVLADKAGNYARLEEATRVAAKAGADIVVSPEGYLDGYAGNSGLFPGVTAEKLRELAEPEDGIYVSRARALARELQIHLVLGLSELRGDRAFNSAFLIGPDGVVVGRYSKSHLNPKAEALYSPGTDFPVFETRLGTVGMLICYDRQLPEPARILGIQGAQLLLAPGYSRNVGEVNELLLLRVRAYENGYNIAWVSPFNVMMIDREGQVVAEDQSSKEGIIYATFDLKPPPDDRTPLTSRRPELYQSILEARKVGP